jgi:uncharacterized protein YcgI (DUF1989 family)
MTEGAGLSAGCRQVIVPARSGRAVGVSRGDQVRVVDSDGHQVGDMWAVDAADHERWLSVSHTRDRCERLFPAVGGQFCDQLGKPVLTLAGDTSPGVHDMLFPPCDRWLYESRGLAGHPNCRDNFLAAAASAGIVLPAVPDPVNLFQNSGPQPDGTLAIGVAASSPGDAITFIASRDLVIILTACSVDYPPLNQGHCSPLRVEISPRGQTAAPTRLPALHQVLAAWRRFVRFRPEVGYPGDQPPGELEERHGIVAAAIEGPLEPRHPVTLVSDHDLRPQMPVARVFPVEPQVCITPPDALP